MESITNSTTTTAATATAHNNNNSSNNNNINFLWDSRVVDWTATTTSNNNSNNAGGCGATATTFSDEPACRTTSAHALLFSHPPEIPHHHHHHHYYAGAGGFYVGATAGSHLHPDPHLTCLKLGKRHYFEDNLAGAGAGGGTVLVGERHVEGFPIGKRGRCYEGSVGGGSVLSAVTPATAVAVPRCQVEGCHVALVNAKDYHRRHKVCEMHSKAPKVVVLGIEQRFCQQCSRFHVVSEFDDSKRSCRRRLAGHNERRRKSSTDSISRNLSQDHRSISGRFPCISSSTGRALSLLSSKSTSWVSPADLSSRSSAALRELIAENRAAFLARQLLLDQAWHHHSMDDMSGAAQSTVLSHMPHQHQAFQEPSDWDRFHDSGAHVTLDLMQEPSSPFGFLSGRSKSKDDDEDCCDIWKSLEGTHVM